MTTFTFNNMAYCHDMMGSLLQSCAKELPMAKRQLRLLLKLKHLWRAA
jgi:hypothetical protein